MRKSRPVNGTEKAIKKHIVFLEDDPGMREGVIRLMQDQLGVDFGVTEFDDGYTAFAYLQSMPEPVDLVITDHRHPGMWGRDLLSELHFMYPLLPILFFTGDEHLLPLLQPLAPYVVCCPKPFEVKKLLEMMRRMLCALRSLTFSVVRSDGLEDLLQARLKVLKVPAF